MALSLKATIGLITSPFTTGVSKMVGSIKKLGGKIRGMVTGAVGKFAMLAGAAGLGMLIRKTIALGSEMSDLADRTHTTVERFGALRDVARDAGVESSILERALRNVGLRAQAAADGNQNYKRALERLKIPMEDFLALDSGLKFEQIAKAVEKAGNKSEAFRDAATILGERAGPMLTEVLRKVAEEGLDPLADSLVECGVIMSEQTAKSLDTLEDMFGRFKDQLVIVTGKMLNAFIPANADAKDAMNDLVDKGVVLLAKAIGTLFIALKNTYDFLVLIVDIAEDLVDVFEDLGPAFDLVVEAFKAMKKGGIMGNLDAMNKLGEAGDLVADAFKKHAPNMKADLKKWGDEVKVNAGNFKDLHGEAGMFAFLAKIGENNVRKMGAEVKGMKNDMQDANAAANGIANNIFNAKNNVQFMVRRLARLEKEINDANDGAKALAGFFGDADKALGNILKNEKIRAREVKRIKEMQEAAQKARQAMVDLTKEGFNALVAEKAQLEFVVLEWLKAKGGIDAAKMSQEELDAAIVNSMQHLPVMRTRYDEINERLETAKNKLGDVNVVMDLGAAKAELQRDHWQELMDNVHGAGAAAQALVAFQVQLANNEVDAAVLAGDPEKIKEAEDALAKVLAKQIEVNAKAAEHPMFEPDLINPEAADFRIFKEQKTILQQIDKKLGGFFVNL